MATNRSPNYPAVSLPDALELVTRLYQKEKRAAVDPELVVRAWGYTTLSGVARTKLSALRKYSLIDDTGKGFRVSDLAMAILYSHSNEERAAALRDAATAPELFRELATHVGASDDNLAARLIRMGFTEAGAKHAVASYRETMGIVPGEKSDYDGPHVEDPSVLVPAAATVGRDRDAASPMPAGAGHVLNIDLPGGVQAQVRLSGTLNKNDLELLREYLLFLEKTIPQAKAEALSDTIPTSGAAPNDDALRS